MRFIFIGTGAWWGIFAFVNNDIIFPWNGLLDECWLVWNKNVQFGTIYEAPIDSIDSNV